MKLYGSLTSPFVRKVRAVAIEREIALDFEPEDPWQKSERLLALNPAGKVPVLTRENGPPLVESLLIIEYLDRLGDPSGAFLPLDGEPRWAALLWHARAQALIEATVARTLETRRPEARQMPERIAREEERFASVLSAVETGLPREGWIGGARIGLGDVMLGVALRYAAFRYPHEWAPTHPRTAALLARLEERPSLINTEPPGMSIGG